MYKKIVVAVLAVIGVLAAYRVILGEEIFHENVTTSAPRGIYLSVPNDGWDRGDMVVLVTDRPFGKMKAGSSLMKHIRGVPGDVYTVEKDRFIIGGKSYPIYHYDYLPQLPVGTYALGEDEYIVMNNPDKSFDSRYFGPVKAWQLKREVVFIYNYERFYGLASNFKRDFEFIRNMFAG